MSEDGVYPLKWPFFWGENMRSMDFSDTPRRRDPFRGQLHNEGFVVSPMYLWLLYQGTKMIQCVVEKLGYTRIAKTKIASLAIACWLLTGFFSAFVHGFYRNHDRFTGDRWQWQWILDLARKTTCLGLENTSRLVDNIRMSLLLIKT